MGRGGERPAKRVEREDRNRMEREGVGPLAREKVCSGSRWM
jgi:hypothetical protein